MISGDWIEVLQEFNELAGDNWKIKMNRMLRGKDPETSSTDSQNTSDLQMIFKRLVISVKYLIIEEKTGELDELKEILHNDILYTLLMQYEKEKVSAFDCYAGKLSLLYFMGEKNLADELVQDIFENAIIQVNSTLYMKFRYYGFESENELRQMANMLDSLVMSAAKKRLGASDFKIFLSYKFTHETNMIEKIAEQYAKHYSQLRERYSIELNEKKEKLFPDKVNHAI